MRHLTKGQIEALPCNPGNYFRSTGQGLYIYVTHDGMKQWIFKFKVGKKIKQLLLGSFPEMDINDARIQSIRWKQQLETWDLTEPLTFFR